MCSIRSNRSGKIWRRGEGEWASILKVSNPRRCTDSGSHDWYGWSLLLSYLDGGKVAFLSWGLVKLNLKAAKPKSTAQKRHQRKVPSPIWREQKIEISLRAEVKKSTLNSYNKSRGNKSKFFEKRKNTKEEEDGWSQVSRKGKMKQYQVQGKGKNVAGGSGEVNGAKSNPDDDSVGLVASSNLVPTINLEQIEEKDGEVDQDDNLQVEGDEENEDDYEMDDLLDIEGELAPEELEELMKEQEVEGTDLVVAGAEVITDASPSIAGFSISTRQKF